MGVCKGVGVSAPGVGRHQVTESQRTGETTMKQRHKASGMRAALIAAALLACAGARADTYVWTNKATSGTWDWSAAGNWSGGAVPPVGGASDATVQIYNSADAFATGFAPALTNDVGAGTPPAFVLNTLVLNGKQSSGTPAYTVRGDTLHFAVNGAVEPIVTIPNNGGVNGSLTINVSNPVHLDDVGTLTIASTQYYYGPVVRFSGAITGTGNVKRTGDEISAGPPRVELTGNKTFSGNVSVAGGTQRAWLVLGGNNAFSGDVTVGNKGWLTVNSDAVWTGSTTVDAGGTLEFPLPGGASVSKDIANSGTLRFSKGVTTGTMTMSGVISGSGTVFLSRESHTVILNGASTYTGKTTLDGYGTASINAIGSVDPDGTGPATAFGRPNSVANGMIDMNNAFLTYTGPQVTTDRIINLSGITAGGTITANGSGPMVFTSGFTATGAGSKTLALQGANTAENTIEGAILDNSTASGRLTSLTKNGAGLWVLKGDNTTANYYSGVTTISQGTLRGTLGSGGSIGGGNINITGPYQANTVLESGADIIRPGGSGVGEMRVQNGNAAAWSGFSARGGDITVAFGSEASPASLTWGTAPFNPGQKFILNVSTADSVLDFRNAINLNAATRTFRVDAAQARLSGILSTASGTAGLTKEGGGTLVVGGDNTYNGATAISAGTLAAGHANAFGTSGTITANSGGTFAVANGITFTRGVTFNNGSGLGGIGTFVRSGAWTLPATFTVRPGLWNAPGTLTLDTAGGAVSFGNNTLHIDFDGTAADKFVLTGGGALNLGGATDKLVVRGTVKPGTYVLAEAAGGISGTFGTEDLAGLDRAGGRIAYEPTRVLYVLPAAGTAVLLR